MMKERDRHRILTSGYHLTLFPYNWNKCLKFRLSIVIAWYMFSLSVRTVVLCGLSTKLVLIKDLKELWTIAEIGAGKHNGNPGINFSCLK